MATFGSVNNSSTENSDGNSRFTGGVMTEAGTLTDLAVYANGWTGGATFRFAIYQGGTAGDPTGATLIWDSGQVSDTNNTAGWRTMTGSYSLSPSGALTASRTWIFIRCNDGGFYLTNTDKGNWDTGSEQSASTNLTSNAFASTVPTDPGSAGAEAIKAYITYTPSTPTTPVKTMYYSRNSNWF